jgi:predicted HTH domain antitoxin
MRIAVEKVQSGSISIGRVAELLNVPVTSIFVANAEIVA